MLYHCDGYGTMQVEKTFHDNLTRQITESFYIFKTEQQTDFELINAKSEWNAPTLYTVYPIPRGLGQEVLE